MNAVIKNLEVLLSLDGSTLAIIAVLCACAAFFIKDYLGNPTMIIFVYPVLVFFSILTQYFFVAMETFPLKKLDQWLMWTIMSVIIGTIVGTGLVACLVRLRERLGSRPS
jgi:Na+/citrate or Na+/malate symporter